jgi:hypothetical protein
VCLERYSLLNKETSGALTVGVTHLHFILNDFYIHMKAYFFAYDPTKGQDGKIVCSIRTGQNNHIEVNITETQFTYFELGKVRRTKRTLKIFKIEGPRITFDSDHKCFRIYGTIFIFKNYDPSTGEEGWEDEHGWIDTITFYPIA